MHIIPSEASRVKQASRKSGRLKRHKSMLIIDGDGLICYRTRLYPSPSQAAPFARCVEANPCFRDVEIRRSDVGRGFFVAYRPVSKERMNALYERLQNDRMFRALREMGGWEITDQGGGRFLVKTHVGQTGEACYEVTTTRCTCLDFCTRLKRADLVCKHIFAIVLHTSEAVPSSDDPFAQESFDPVPHDQQTRNAA